MSQVLKKFLGNDAVDGLKFKLLNDQALRARNAANSADVELMKLDSANKLKMLVQPEFDSAPTANEHLVNKAYADTKVAASTVGQANGVCPLGSDGKVASSFLPSYVDDVIEAADLASFPVTGETGKIYVALDTNLAYRWGGSVYTKIATGDVASVNGQTGNVVLGTDQVAEGSTNKYYTAARARTDVLASSITSGDTTHAPTAGAVYTALGGKANTFQGAKENVTLQASDISNGYVDLAQAIMPNTLDVVVSGLVQVEGVDYSLSQPGSVTRVTFSGDLAAGGAAALVAGDVIRFKYLY